MGILVAAVLNVRESLTDRRRDRARLAVPHGALKHSLDAAGFSDVKIKSERIDRQVHLTMRLGRNPPYASVRDVRVAVQRVVRSIGFTVRRDGYLLRLHTGRVTAKFRVAKRRPS